MKKEMLCGLIAGLMLWATLPVSHTPYALSETAFAQQTLASDAKTDFLQIGFALMKENIGLISIGAADSSILKALGEPEKKSTARIWAADGMEHQRWHYQTKGIELDMVRKESNQAVNMIIIKNPCDYKTQRGIQIGSSDTEVQNAYKNEINPQDSKLPATIVAGTVYGGIIFGLTNGFVTSIFIGAATE